MKKTFIILILSFIFRLSFGQTGAIVSTYTYKKTPEKILFIKDSAIVTVSGNEIQIDTTVYTFDSVNVYKKDKLIAGIAGRSVIINNKLYQAVDTQEKLSWVYQSGTRTVLECHYRKDVTDAITVGLVTQDTTADVAILQAVALKRYSELIVVKKEHNNLYLYISLGILHGIAFFILANAGNR